MNVFDDMAALLDAAREDSECPYPTYSRMIDLYYNAKDENEALWRTIGNCDDEIERLIDATDNLRRKKEMDQVYMERLVYLLKAEEGVSDRLRELCAEMFEAVKCCCGEWCAKTASNCDNDECRWRKCYVALRELGIEVD